MSVIYCPILRFQGGEPWGLPKCRLAPFYRNRSYGESEEWAAYAFLDNDVPCLDLQRAGRYGTTIVYKIKGAWFWGWEWYSDCNLASLHPNAQLGRNTCNEDG